MKTAIEIMYWIAGSLLIITLFLFLGSMWPDYTSRFGWVMMVSIVLAALTLIADSIYKSGLKDGEQDDEHGRK